METSGKKWGLALVAIGALVVGVWLLMAVRQGGTPNLRPTKGGQEEGQKMEPTSILVQVGDTQKRISIPSGDVLDESVAEPDFAKYSGLPRAIEAKGQTVSTRSLLSDRTGQNMIVDHTVLASAKPGAEPETVSTGEFMCDSSAQSCTRSNVFGGRYRIGSNQNIATGELWWLGWSNAEKRLVGYIASEENDPSSIYVCASDTNVCQVSGSQGKRVTGNVVPGALSPSQQMVVLIDQHDTPNEVTGKTWDALVYDVTNLAEPKYRYDISALIDTDGAVGYDSVRSIGWEPGEERIALGTERKIALLDLKNGALTPLFTDSKTDSEEGTWQNDALTFTSDGRFIVFVDNAGVIEDEADMSANAESQANEDETDADTLKGDGVEIGALTILPVDGKGKVQSVYEAPELSLSF